MADTKPRHAALVPVNRQPRRLQVAQGRPDPGGSLPFIHLALRPPGRELWRRERPTIDA